MALDLAAASSNKFKTLTLRHNTHTRTQYGKKEWTEIIE
jgi:hypothetical protein